MSQKPKLPELIDSAMSERGWSRKRLARESGLSFRQVCRILNEYTPTPMRLTLRAIALALEMDPEALEHASGVPARTGIARVVDDAALERGLTILELALRAGVSERALIRILNGETARPTRRTLERLELALELEAGALAQAEPPDPREDRRHFVDVMNEG